MTGHIQSIATGKKIATKGFVYQLACSAVLVAFAIFFFDAEIGVSVALGAITSIFPNAVFSFFAFRFSGARQSQLVARSFGQGSKVKLAMTIGFFVIAFAWLQATPLPLFAAYFAITAVYWTVLYRASAL